MPNKRMLKKSTILLVLIISTGLAWAGDKKNNNPPPPPPKPAPQARPAPPQRPPAPAENRPNPGGGGYHPTTPSTGGAGYHPTTPSTGGAGYHPTAPSTGGGGYHPTAPPTGGGGYHPTAPPTRIVATHGGGQMEVGSNNKPVHFAGNRGEVASFNKNGNIRQFHDPGKNMTVEHGLRRGDTRIVSENNGRRLVSTGPHGGYSERHYIDRNGHTYYQRTYWAGGHPYARVYRGYEYRGVRY